MSSKVDFDDRIPSIVVELEPKVERDVDSIARDIAKLARTLAPKLKTSINYPSFHREPGWLAESIDVDKVPDGGTAIRVGVFYGHFQEYGTKHHEAQPYLIPAAIVYETELVRRVKTTLERL